MQQTKNQRKAQQAQQMAYRAQQAAQQTKNQQKAQQAQQMAYRAQQMAYRAQQAAQQAQQVAQQVAQQAAQQVAQQLDRLDVIRRKIQQYYLGNQRQEQVQRKLREIDAAIAENNEPNVLELILVELFELFLDLYNRYTEEFNIDRGPAFHLLEIINDLKRRHPNIGDINDVLLRALGYFQGLEHDLLEEILVNPMVEVWASDDALSNN